MAYIRNAQDVKERCSESVIFYAERIAAFKKIERQTKKDGKDFAVMSKNFKVAKGCGVYITITDRHTAKDRYKIDISYHGSRGWNDDWIYFENADDLENKISALIENDTARKQEREKETEKAERAAAFALEKLAEISAYLDGIKAEKNNTLRYAIGEMVENYRFNI